MIGWSVHWLVFDKITSWSSHETNSFSFEHIPQTTESDTNIQALLLQSSNHDEGERSCSSVVKHGLDKTRTLVHVPTRSKKSCSVFSFLSEILSNCHSIGGILNFENRKG